MKIEVGGGGFLVALGFGLIALRIAGVIDWHWAWVLAPLWGPLAFGVVVVLLILVVLAMIGAAEFLVNLARGR